MEHSAGKHEEATYTHNGLDQIVGMPGYITGAITYGQNSYLSGYTFANGVSLNREYDNKRRLTRMEYGLEGEELHRFTFDYDREDNVIQKNSDFFSYDGMNRLLSASLTGKEANMEYAYEGEGQTRMVRPDPLGDQVMELAGEDLTLDWGAGSLGIDLGYGYRVIKMVLKPQSLATRLTAETLEVYTALYNKEGYWDKPVEFTFERDETTGEITLNFDEVQFARYLKIHSHFYEMNEAGEALDGDATLELRGGDPFDVSILSSGRNEFYRYDAKGNREGKSHFTKDFVSYTYTYYSGSDWIKTDGRYGYTYDANGNMLERGSTYEEEGDGLTILKEGDYHRYDYDLTNRLRAVYRWDEEEGTEVLVKRYTYNAAGYRILAEDALGAQVFYTFDLEGKVIERSDSDGTRNYVFLGSKVIAFKEDGKTYYYGTDHLGSTTLITDASGETVWSGAVTPFADQESSDDGESVLFTGKELDHDTGLYYFNARWYDPELGRFITEDPIRDGVNWYVYVGNNPLGYTDPTGLKDVVTSSADEEQELQSNTWGDINWVNKNVTNEEFEATKIATWEMMQSDTVAGSRMRYLESSRKSTSIIVTNTDSSKALPGGDTDPSMWDLIKSVIGIGGDSTILLNPRYRSGSYPDGSPRFMGGTSAHEGAHAALMVIGINPLFRYQREMDGMMVENEYRDHSGNDQRKEYGYWGPQNSGFWKVPIYDATSDSFIYPDGYLSQSLFGHSWNFSDAP